MSTSGIAVPLVWFMTGPPRCDFSPGLTPATTSNPISEVNRPGVRSIPVGPETFCFEGSVVAGSGWEHADQPGGRADADTSHEGRSARAADAHPASYPGLIPRSQVRPGTISPEPTTRRPPRPSVESMKPHPSPAARPTSAPDRTGRRRPRHLRRTAALLGSAAVIVGATGCSAVTGALTRDGASAWEFDTGSEGKSVQVLPDWVPDDAAAVRMVARAGGEEHILTMRTSPDRLPASCTPAHPAEAADSADYRRVSTLSADWWSTEQEQAATIMCGSWWVVVEGDSLYAFTPERRTVAVG